MPIRRFRDPALSDYYFDTIKEVVVSTKRGFTHEMKWSQARSWYPKRITLINCTGRKIYMTKGDVLLALKPVEKIVETRVPQKTSPVTSPIMEITVANFGHFAHVKPNVDYIMYGEKQKVSQFFKAGTSVLEALQIFERRKITLSPEEIRIFYPSSGAVRKIEAKVTYTYELV